MNAPVILVRDEAGVRVLSLNRPRKRNALDTALTQALVDALEAADRDPTVRALVLRGEGGSFCAGADVGEFGEFTSDRTAAVEARAALTARLHHLVAHVSKPVVAALCGAAMGGGAGLALGCDLLVMARDARLGYPEVTRGIVPAIVMTNLVRQLGRKRAFELAGLGAPIDGEIAERWGLANRMVDATEVDGVAEALARRMAGFSTRALASTKRLMAEVADLPYAAGLERGRLANIEMRGFES